MKLLVGKPDRRKAVGVPLDDEIFAPMLRSGRADAVPCALARRRSAGILERAHGPAMGPSARVVVRRRRTRPKRRSRRRSRSVFRRHPRLRLILPHFFFLSDRLDDAAALLEAYPSYMLDLAPGVEMFHNFSARRDDARAFFLRFADRIIFGSDFGMTCGWGRDRGMMIRRFLETDEVFDVPEDPAMTPDDRPPLRGHRAAPRGAGADLRRKFPPRRRRAAAADRFNMLRKLILNLHIYAGLLCFGYLIVFGVSSLNFNHPFAFTRAKASR